MFCTVKRAALENKGLTRSVEHHEDRPLLSLQQLPEVLQRKDRGNMINKPYHLLMKDMYSKGWGRVRSDNVPRL